MSPSPRPPFDYSSVSRGSSWNSDTEHMFDRAKKTEHTFALDASDDLFRATVRSRRVWAAASLFVALAAGASLAYPDSSAISRPTRGYVATVLPNSLEWSLADLAGLLGSVLLALVPLLQLLRVITARSVAGLSPLAWMLSAWALSVAVWQGASAGDLLLVSTSLFGACAAWGVVLSFRRFGSWSWASFSSAAGIVFLTAAGVLISRSAGDAEWFVCLLAALPFAMLLGIETLRAVVLSESRAAVAVSALVLSSLGYILWFFHSASIGSAVVAAMSGFLALSFIATLAAALYFGLGSSGTSAADAVLFQQVRHLPRAIAMHRPVFDDQQNLIDLEFIWANDNWQSYRVSLVPRGSLASDHRVRFEELLPYLRQAWTDGKATQFFRLDRETDERLGFYSYTDAVWDAEIEVETVFVRIESGLILEWGDDLDAKVRLGSELQEQRLRAEQRRQTLVAKLATRSEQSRFHMALHDNILQELFVLQIGLEAGTFAGIPPEEAERARATVEKVSKDIRSLIEGSRDADDLLPLDDRVNEMLAAWSISEERIPLFKFQLSGTDATVLERLPAEEARCVFHIIKESVANAVKHAEADLVSISIAVDASGSDPLIVSLHAEVLDDGRGLPPDNTRSSGLSNMSERAAAFGGQVAVTDALPHLADGGRPERPGTRVAILLPSVQLELI